MTGKCIIISAPSGAGKTTIVHHLLKQNLNLEFSISACSRQKRATEIDGKDYYFIELNKFKQKIDNGDFLEWEEVYANHFYGTLRTEIHRIWEQEKHVIFEVDVAGGLKLKKIFGSDALAIFIMPPSKDILKERLLARKTGVKENLTERLTKAEKEMNYMKEYDKVVINDNLSHAKRDTTQLVIDFLAQ